MSQAPTPTSDMICVAAIANAHGIQGCVKIKTFNADPAQLNQFNPMIDEVTQKPINIRKVVSVNGDLVIAHLEGVTDRNAAEALKGHKLMIPRGALPKLGNEDEFYHADLIDLPIQTTAGKAYGKVLGIYNFGAGDVLEVEVEATNKNEFIPFTKDIIPNVTSTHLIINLDALKYVIAKEEKLDND